MEEETMEFSPNDHCTLADALALLARGDWRSFENQLWIGFGDRWDHVRTMLIQHQHVRLTGQWKDEPTITERGEVLMQRLASRPNSVAS